MKFDLCEKLRCLLDQPVRIFTDDERIVAGMVVGVNEDFVRVHDGCGDIFLVSICHIASIEEPHMRLRRCCCRRNRCEAECGCCEEDGKKDDFEDDDCDRRKKYDGDRY